MFENLTAQQIVESLSSGNLYSSLINLAFLLCGFSYNIYMQLNREGITLKEYWDNYRGRSFASVSALVTSFFGMLLLSPEASVLAYFTLGFTSDAIINKAPTRQELVR